MLDFIEKEVSITSLPESSQDTQTVSDSRPDTSLKSVGDWQKETGFIPPLADPAVTAATIAALAAGSRDLTVPWEYVQNEKEIN